MNSVSVLEMPLADGKYSRRGSCEDFVPLCLRVEGHRDREDKCEEKQHADASSVPLIAANCRNEDVADKYGENEKDGHE